MSFTYRPCAKCDAEILDAIFRKSFIDTFGHLYSSENLEAFLANFTREAWEAELTDEHYGFQLAEAEGRPVGFVKLGPSALPIAPGGPAIELRQFYLLHECHGTGVAHALMEWAIGEARVRGAREMYLTVYTDNRRARRFYERFGFEAIGPYKFMVGNQADEDIIMRRAL